MEALGAVFIVFVALETCLEIAGFLSCNASRAVRLARVNHDIFEACKQLNSRWLIAEGMTDDRWKANGVLNPQPCCPWQAGAGGYIKYGILFCILQVNQGNPYPRPNSLPHPFGLYLPPSWDLGVWEIGLLTLWELAAGTGGTLRPVFVSLVIKKPCKNPLHKPSQRIIVFRRVFKRVLLR